MSGRLNAAPTIKEVICLFWLVFTVCVDSLVTLFVGWRLERAAKKHTAAAAESIRPTLQKAVGDEIANALHNVLPVLVPVIKEKFGVNSAISEPTSSETATGIKSNDRANS